MYQNPDILVEATNPMAEEDLPLMKAALKYGWDKTNALIENRVALFDMLYAGYCAVEVDILPELKNRNQPEAEQPQEEEPKSIFNKIADNFRFSFGSVVRNAFCFRDSGSEEKQKANRLKQNAPKRNPAKKIISLSANKLLKIQTSINHHNSHNRKTDGNFIGKHLA